MAENDANKDKCCGKQVVRSVKEWIWNIWLVSSPLWVVYFLAAIYLRRGFSYESLDIVTTCVSAVAAFGTVVDVLVGTVKYYHYIDTHDNSDPLKKLARSVKKVIYIAWLVVSPVFMVWQATARINYGIEAIPGNFWLGFAVYAIAITGCAGDLTLLVINPLSKLWERRCPKLEGTIEDVCLMLIGRVARRARICRS